MSRKLPSFLILWLALACSTAPVLAQAPPAAGGGGGGGGGGGATERLGGVTGGTRGGSPNATLGAPARDPNQSAIGRVLFRGTSRQIEEVRRIIAENDRLPRQVLLETYLMDVNVNRADNAGITFQTFFGTARDFGGVPLGGYTFDNRLQDVNQTIRFGSLSTERFQLFLQFLKNYTDSRILNRPSALVLDGGTATLNLGGQVNFLSRVDTTVTAQGTVVTSPVTDSINTGQNLVVTPRIMPNDIVLLNLTLDDTTVTEFRTFGQGASQVTLPQTTRRALVSPMFLKNGTAVIIGGLKNTQATRESAKLPFLSQIPLIGRNFGRNVKSSRSNELVLIMKATVYAPEDF